MKINNLEIQDYYGQEPLVENLTLEELHELQMLSQAGSTADVRLLDDYTVIKELKEPDSILHPEQHLELLGYKSKTILCIQKLVLVKDQIVGFTMAKAKGRDLSFWRSHKSFLNFGKMLLALRTLDQQIINFSHDRNEMFDLKLEHFYYNVATTLFEIIDTDDYAGKSNVVEEKILCRNRSKIAEELSIFFGLDQEQIANYIKKNPKLLSVQYLVDTGHLPFFQLLKEISNTLYETPTTIEGFEKSIKRKSF